MCPPVMAVGIGITDALGFQVYLAPLCVQRQMELDSCPWALQWVFPKVTFQTQPQRVDLKAWTCGREHERQVFQGPEPSLLSAGRGCTSSVPASQRCLSQSYSQAGVLGVHLRSGLGCAGDGPQGLVWARKALSHLSHTRSPETGFSPSGTLRQHLSLRLSCWWWPDWAVSFTWGPSGCRFCTELAFGAPCSAGASPALFCSPPPFNAPGQLQGGSSQNYHLSLTSTPTPLLPNDSTDPLSLSLGHALESRPSPL